MISTLRTADEWQQYTGIKVLDPDGWRAGNLSALRYPIPWGTPITYTEFMERVATSTVRVGVSEYSPNTEADE